MWLPEMPSGRPDLVGLLLFFQACNTSVESGLLQPSLTTVCADRLAAAFLLRDSLAPLLAPLLLFCAHLSNMCRIPSLE
jgi:hypothetical protein